jgi:hypothetical protein
VTPPATTVRLPISLRSDIPAVALQFDLSYDPTRLRSAVPAPGSALAGHALESTELGPGSRRILLYSLANAPLGSGTIASLPLTVASAAAEGVVTLTLTNVVLATPAGTRIVPLTLGAGQVTISLGSPARLELSVAGDRTATLRVNGSIGRSYVIQASGELSTWVSISTNLLPTGTANYQDLTAPAHSVRFYRAWLQP